MFIFKSLSALCAAALLSLSVPTTAQTQLSLVDCPSEAKVFNKTSTSQSNNTWNTFATTTESVVELSISAKSTDAKKADFVLMLDLDGDGEQETRVDSRNLPEAGMIPFNNEFGIEKDVAFGSDYTFAVQTAEEADVLVARLVFADADGNFQPLVLPQGQHAIVWTITTEKGESASCFQMFQVKSGKATAVPAHISLNETFETKFK